MTAKDALAVVVDIETKLRRAKEQMLAADGWARVTEAGRSGWRRSAGPTLMTFDEAVHCARRRLLLNANQ